MRWKLRRLAVASLGCTTILFAPAARASTEAVAPPAGGLAATAVKVDLAAGVVRYKSCASLPCSADGGGTLPIALDRKLFPDAREVSVTVVPIGEKSVVHVRVPAKADAPDKIAFEAVIAASGVLFSGPTGLTQGQPGDRTGVAVQVEGTLLVGDVREDLRICGQDTTLLSPRGLDPKTMTFVGAGFQRLPSTQRAAAQLIVASANPSAADPPLAPLLVVAGASTAIGNPASLVDGDPKTGWSEGRPSAGAGEFVLFRAPAEVPIARVTLSIAAASPSPNGAAPKKFYFVTAARTFAVTMPQDAWLYPGASYDVVFPEALRGSCLAIVLDEAYARGQAHPEVTIAEVTAYSEFDAPGATLDTVAKALSGGGARADAAAAVLKRAKNGLDPVLHAWSSLDASGRALATDVAMTAPCEASAPLLIRAMGDADPEVARKGRGKLERCGKAAGPALVDALKEPERRLLVAPLLATLAPTLGIDPLADALAQGPPKTRAEVRGALARVARTADVAKLAALVADNRREENARIDLLRACGARLAELRPQATAAIADLLRNPPSMRTRYLLLGPLAELARAGDADATARFTAFLASDPEAAVRTHATELGGAIPALRNELIARLDDPEPRVREAALLSIAQQHLAVAAPKVEAVLQHDPWTFVRGGAAGALASMPGTAEIDGALVASLEDTAPRVRSAALDALAVHRAKSFVGPVRAKLADPHERADVRTAAAHALGEMCDAGSLDSLEKLAGKAASPVASESETAVGLAAIDALGRIHPTDLARRFGKFSASDVPAEARRAVDHALGQPATCR
ncbi:MAG: HEAT repeat domain-containing protein [Polyangiaceae bacterium]